MARTTKRRGSAQVEEKPKRERKPRPKQTEIPDTIKRIKAIDDAADDYVEKRDARMACTEEEVEAKEKLLGLMKKHGQTVYRLDDEKIVEIVHETETVKVRRHPIDKPKPKQDTAAVAE